VCGNHQRTFATKSAKSNQRTAANSISFDHFVGQREQCRRDFDGERLGGLEVDDELEFRRLQNGEIGRFFSLRIRAV